MLQAASARMGPGLTTVVAFPTRVCLKIVAERSAVFSAIFKALHNDEVKEE